VYKRQKEFTPFVIEHIPSKDLTPEQISISQSLMRAICSLEKKGIITSRIEPTERDEDGNRMNVGGKYIDLIDLYAKKNRPLVAKYHYLRKCLVKLSHRQKYLNKRLEEIEAIKNG